MALIRIFFRTFAYIFALRAIFPALFRTHCRIGDVCLWQAGKQAQPVNCVNKLTKMRVLSYSKEKKYQENDMMKANTIESKFSFSYLRFAT